MPESCARTNNNDKHNTNCFKEAVCINAGRIYDSCSDKDCLEDLQVHFTDVKQAIIDTATNVKCKEVSVLKVLMDVESVPFNKGFYAVDMTYYFLIRLEALQNPMNCAEKVEGVAVFTKKVILYGSEGKTKVFTSADTYCAQEDDCAPRKDESNPKAVVQVANPISLACKICECPDLPMEPCLHMPENVGNQFDGCFGCVHPKKMVCISLGIFSIVHLERNIQVMIPVYEYNVPDKEGVYTTDDPCDIFKKIKFPMNEFFPPKLEETQDA